MVKRYLTRISGPLLDRIDLHVEVTPVSFEELSSFQRPPESSKDIAQRVIQIEHLAEAIHFRSLDRENWAG